MIQKRSKFFKNPLVSTIKNENMSNKENPKSNNPKSNGPKPPKRINLGRTIQKPSSSLKPNEKPKK